MSLIEVFQKINQESFDGFLELPKLIWNSRLRSSAGRFVPGRRKFLHQNPPTIEIASYLIEETQAKDLIYDTMAHEMIHYWLWVRQKPYGHTPEFLAKMKLMGVSRYNSVPRTRPHKYIYKCPACSKDFPAKRRLGTLACANCCKQYAGGRFDVRFKLFLDQILKPSRA
jgi:SprT protein